MHWQGPAAPGPPSGVRCLLMAFPFICFDWKAYQTGRQLPRTMLPQPLQLIQAPAAAATAGFRATSHTFQPAASCLLLPCSFHIVLIFYCCEPHVPVLLRCMDLIDVGEGKVPKHTVNNVEKTLAKHFHILLVPLTTGVFPENKSWKKKYVKLYAALSTKYS